VARIDVAELLIDESIEAKLRRKRPPLTGAEVEEVAVWSRDAITRWHTDPRHGRRLIVRGATYEGRKIIAYLIPVDEIERIFKLKTARIERTT
jgi:hypothetical protein